MPQSTLTISNQSSLNNNLWPLYELLSSSFLFSVQLQQLIWTSYIKTSFQLFLVTQLLQNKFLQIANSLQTQTVFSSLTTEFMYHPPVASAYVSSSIIMIMSLSDIIVKTKHWNQFTIDISKPVSMLTYNNSISLVSLVCNLSHNIISLTDLSNNSLFLNNYGILFLWTLSRNFCHSPYLTLSQSQSTGLPSRQYLSLPMDLAHLFVLHVFSKHSISFHVISNRGSEFVSNFFYSLDTALDMWLHFTSGYYPEGDRQTKCMNQILKQYLCVYYNYQQDNWSELLFLTEFAYDNVLSATTGISLFFANKGYHLNITVHPKCNVTFF